VRASADATGTAIPLAEFERLIDARTLLVSVPHVCYRNGARLDLEPIVALARSRGALVLVDGYQALGTLPIEVPRLGADFLVGGCLKYLLGTAGVGFLYVRDSRRSPLQPTATGWFAQADIGAMDIHHHRPHPSARRFDAGTSNVCGLHAVRAGLELLLAIGLDAVHARIEALTGRLLGACAARGWNVATPAAPRAALIAIRANDAPAVVARLADARIVVSDRDGHVRVSPHFYNDEADIDTLVDALQTHRALLMR
jgi:selenocysteine lyase/cysteine desulfurase